MRHQNTQEVTGDEEKIVEVYVLDMLGLVNIITDILGL